MEKQSHYQLLNIDENASTDIIKLAYERLLKDAKEKLENSPLYFEKEKKLNEAYLVLSNTQRRQFYDKKLLKERIQSHKSNIDNTSESFNFSDFLNNLIFSRIFWGSAALILALLILLPGSNDNINNQTQQKAIKDHYDYQNQQLERVRQTEQLYSASQENYQQSVSKRRQERKEAAEKRQLELEVQRIEQEEQRSLAKIEREERRLKLKQQREEKKVNDKLQRQKNREKLAREQRERQQQYEAKKRAQNLINKQKKQAYIQQRKEKISSTSIK
jgi:DnaJ domain